MARVSRKEAEQHRKDIVEAASHLFRAKGLGRVSVPELMAAAGMTHGGFYGHFASKDALAAEAFEAAFRQMNERIATSAQGRSWEAACAGLIDSYLSCEHRDHPESGCAAAGLLDFPRDTDSEAVRAAYAKGVAAMLDAIEAAQAEAIPEARPAAMATLATLVGSLLLARATKDTPLSEAFLDAGRASLEGKDPFANPDGPAGK
jgi:TetR/AcrR family transcriptional repressor of nem operon